MFPFCNQWFVFKQVIPCPNLALGERIPMTYIFLDLDQISHNALLQTSFCVPQHHAINHAFWPRANPPWALAFAQTSNIARLDHQATPTVIFIGNIQCPDACGDSWRGAEVLNLTLLYNIQRFCIYIGPCVLGLLKNSQALFLCLFASICDYFPR